MNTFYKPLSDRVPDTQYQDRVKHILAHGEMIKETPQGVGALTCFGTLAPMVFDPRNGIPMLTERSMETFWRKPIGEIFGMINGETTIDGLESYGCKGFWSPYRGKGTVLGLAPDDLGPGSYGAAFHDFPVPRPWWKFWAPKTLNQFEQLLDQIRQYPSLRTHLVTPWIPFYTACGPNRKVQIAPCHGWVHVRVINGRLHLLMSQRSGDFPLGVPNNMLQYAALHLAICQMTGFKPGNYIHYIADVHIYENQIEKMKELAERKPRPFPILRLDPSVTNLFDFRTEHFNIEEYDPCPAMKIPYSP
ncbi:MAG: thymidylate synthase [Candidatus Pacebacteria bacterium]|nr:thymidylate synthase [Candidatus Paceibacterota bacterium]